jgi:hypothetical protein
MNSVLEVATKTAMFLSSIHINDRGLLLEITQSATGKPLDGVLTGSQIAAIHSIMNTKSTPKDVKMYSTAALGCNLGGKSKAQVMLLLRLAGFVDIDSLGNYVITTSGSEYGVMESGKLMWRQSVNRVLRKLI